VPGTSLGTAREAVSAAGNSIVGIFGGGYTTASLAVTDKYTFSGNTVTAGTHLLYIVSFLAAVSASPGGL
jgi:Ethanolamine utilization protein EutJ (predicted chaperonin)